MKDDNITPDPKYLHVFVANRQVYVADDQDGRVYTTGKGIPETCIDINRGDSSLFFYSFDRRDMTGKVSIEMGGRIGDVVKGKIMQAVSEDSIRVCDDDTLRKVLERSAEYMQKSEDPLADVEECREEQTPFSYGFRIEYFKEKGREAIDSIFAAAEKKEAEEGERISLLGSIVQGVLDDKHEQQKKINRRRVGRQMRAALRSYGSSIAYLHTPKINRVVGDERVRSGKEESGEFLDNLVEASSRNDADPEFLAALGSGRSFEYEKKIRVE